MKYSFQDILASYTPEKRRNTSTWARIFSRPLSFVFAYLFVNIGLTANMVSLLSLVEAIIACIFVMLPKPYMLIGVILFLFWDVLDCTDGNIARVTHTSSPVGVFFDAISGYTAVAFIYLSVGVAAFRTSSLFGDKGYIFIIIGAVASLFDLLARLVYQKYQVTEYVTGKDKEDGAFAEKLDSGIYRIANIIMKNLTYSCLLMPLLVLSYIFNTFDYLIMFYSLYSFCFYFASVLIFIRKVRKIYK